MLHAKLLLPIIPDIRPMSGGCKNKQCECFDEKKVAKCANGHRIKLPKRYCLIEHAQSIESHVRNTPQNIFT